MSSPATTSVSGHWPTLRLASWDDFVSHAGRLQERAPADPSYVYRGQGDASWCLVPRLARELGTEVDAAAALRLETMAENGFKAMAHMYLPPALLDVLESKSPTDRWGIMQHHNSPTRLLDWTASPYVAAYFAAEQLPSLDGAIFVTHPHTVNGSYTPSLPVPSTELDRALTSPNPVDDVYFFWPTRMTDRQAAQQGHFSASLNPVSDHQGAILRGCTPGGATEPAAHLVSKWIIPAELKSQFLRQLRVMNVAAHALFPGLDGLGRSFAELVRIHAR